MKETAEETLKNYPSSWSFLRMPFKLQLIVIQPVLKPLPFLHKFSISICVVNRLTIKSKVAFLITTFLNNHNL